MADEVLSTQVKRSNVIPITSLSDLGTVVGEIQNQLGLLIAKLDDDVRPEFKALMEGYVKKANEAESLKVSLEDISSKHNSIKAEILQIRETNRSLVQELQVAREALKNLESQLNSLQVSYSKSEDEYRIKIKQLNTQILEYEGEINELTQMNEKIRNDSEEKRQELLDQNFNLRQNEQELISQRDSLKRQVDEFQFLLKEGQEQLELKTKEAEYKDALLNQLIKQTTEDKARAHTRDKDKKSDGFFGFFNRKG